MPSGVKDIQLLELKDTISQLNKTISTQNELISSLQKMLEERNAKDSEKDLLIANLQSQLAYLKNKVFGSTSEIRHDQLDGQLNLFGTPVGDEKPAEVIEPEVISVKGYTKERKPKATYDDKYNSVRSICKHFFTDIVGLSIKFFCVSLRHMSIVSSIKLQTAHYRKTPVISSAAAHVKAEYHTAYLPHAIRPSHGRIAAVGGASLLISRASALKLIEQISVIIIIRLKSARRLGMFKSRRVVSDAVVGYGAVIIPRAFSLFYLFKDVQSFSEISVLDIVQSRSHILLVLTFALSRLASVPAEAAKAPEVSRSGLLISAWGFALPLIHYQIVSLLDFLELFFIGRLIGVSDVGVGMIFAAQLSVCFFYFFIGSASAYA